MNSIRAARGMWLSTLVARSVCREQVQHRPQSLAATADDVLGDLVDQNHIRSKTRTDQCIDRIHIGSGEGLDIRDCADARRGGAGN